MMTGMIKRLSGRISVMLTIAMLMTIAAPALTANKTSLDSAAISSVTNLAGDLHINVGKAEGVSEGAEGVILRDGREIAKYRVIDVNWGISRISVFDLQDGFTVQAGDQAPVKTNIAPKKSKSSITKVVGVVLAIGLIAALAGGGGGKGSSRNDIDLTTRKTSVINDTGDVTVTVNITAKVNKANGDAIDDGTLVTFNTTAGTLNATQVRSMAGSASAVLTYNSAEDTALEATVTVKCGSDTSKITVSFTSRVDLVADDTTIYLLGSGATPNETTITATCRDIENNPVTSGNVKFTTTIGTIADTVPIGAGGIATTTFTSAQAGKAKITATYSNSTATVTVTVQAGPPDMVNLQSDQDDLPADGNSWTKVTAIVVDTGGNTVTDGTKVRFSVEPDGSSGGGTLSDTLVSTKNGQAATTLKTKDDSGVNSLPGTVTVKAQVLIADQPTTVPAPATDLERTITITFTSVASTEIGSVNLNADKLNIRNAVGNKTNLTAQVATTDGNAVPDGTQVVFTTNKGSISNVIKTIDGKATAVLNADGSAGDGLAVVTATVGSIISNPCTVIFSGPPDAANCEATITPYSLAKSGGQAVIAVTARDSNGYAIVDNTIIEAVTTRGILPSNTAQISNGEASFNLQTSPDSASPTDPGPGTVTITIPSGGAGPNVKLYVEFEVLP
ncbi:MAG: hypothetical protein GX139_09640 [Armatimonadetes bacterium]|jgi:hypothetical protein|nr:hypothetical protein [Armatimonadota bacterium]